MDDALTPSPDPVEIPLAPGADGATRTTSAYAKATVPAPAARPAETGDELARPRTARRAAVLVFVLLYVPFVYNNGYKLLKADSVDFPAYHWASKVTFERHQSPYDYKVFEQLVPETADHQRRRIDLPLGLGFTLDVRTSPGQKLYPFIYLPPSLWAFAPFARMDYEKGKKVMLLANHLCFLVFLYLLLFKIVRAPRGRLVGAGVMGFLAAYALVFDPAGLVMSHGQVNYFVVVLLCLAWLGLRSGRAAPLVGGALGLAIVLKTYPLMFLPLLLVRKKWAASLWAVGLVAALCAASYFLLPSKSIWPEYLAVVKAGGYGVSPKGLFSPAAPWNQSINGFTSRLFLPNEYSDALRPDERLAKLVPLLASLGVLAITGLLSLASARRKGDRLLQLEFPLYLLAMYLVAPLAWEHHLVFVLPAIFVALPRFVFFGRSRLGALAVAAAALGLAWEIPLEADAFKHGARVLAISIKLYAVFALWGVFALALLRASFARAEGDVDPLGDSGPVVAA